MSTHTIEEIFLLSPKECTRIVGDNRSYLADPIATQYDVFAFWYDEGLLSYDFTELEKYYDRSTILRNFDNAYGAVGFYEGADELLEESNLLAKASDFLDEDDEEKSANELTEEMQENIEHANDPHAFIVKKLNQIKKAYESTGDANRARSFKNGAKAFEKYDGEYNLKDLKKIKGVGPSLAGTIVEIYETAKSTRLQGLIEKHGSGIIKEEDRDERQKAIDLLSTVKYIGESAANKLYNAGYMTIQQLQDDDDAPLTDAQRICVDNYEDLNKRIPRKEMDEWRYYFIGLFKCKDYIENPQGDEIRWAICGSYRRLESSSGDVDLVVMDKDINQVVEMLKDTPLDVIMHGDHKFACTIQLYDEDPVRQMDVMVFDKSNWYYALLHSTGSDEFAKLCRTKAKQLGFKILNTYGLYDKNDDLVVVNSEREIFDHLQIEYIAPEDRKKTISSLTDTGKKIRSSPKRVKRGKIPRKGKVKIVSYNIAKNNDEFHYKLIVESIQSLEPDIVCIQEMTRHSYDIFADKLANDYDYISGKFRKTRQDTMTFVKRSVGNKTSFYRVPLTRNDKRTLIVLAGTVNGNKIVCVNGHLESKFKTDEGTDIKASQLIQVSELIERFEEKDTFGFFIGDTNLTGGKQFKAEEDAVYYSYLTDLWPQFRPEFDHNMNNQDDEVWKTRDSTWRSPENKRINDLRGQIGQHYRLDRCLTDEQGVYMINFDKSEMSVLRPDLSDHDGLYLDLKFN
jgi:DNA polymerase/3'-5' exonuclease PolX/endonuclease/exonuclease/phosphatase family metal-dependent hydrolase